MRFMASSTASTGASPLCFLKTVHRAAGALTTILDGLSYRNLDEDPSLSGQNTTTEVLARVVFDRLVTAIERGDLGAGGRAIESLRVTLHESHVAAAAFDGSVNLVS